MSDDTHASHPIFSYSTLQHCCVTLSSHGPPPSDRLIISHTHILTTPERVFVRHKEEVRKILNHMHFLWLAAVLRHALLC